MERIETAQTDADAKFRTELQDIKTLIQAVTKDLQKLSVTEAANEQEAQNVCKALETRVDALTGDLETSLITLQKRVDDETARTTDNTEAWKGVEERDFKHEEKWRSQLDESLVRFDTAHSLSSHPSTDRMIPGDRFIHKIERLAERLETTEIRLMDMRDKFEASESRLLVAEKRLEATEIEMRTVKRAISPHFCVHQELSEKRLLATRGSSTLHDLG